MKEKINDLNESIKSKDFLKVKDIFEKFPNIFYIYTGVLDTPLHFCARYGNLKIMEYIFHKYNPPIDISITGYETCLTVASGENNIEMVSWLISHDAMIDGIGTNILSPLMSAVMGGHLDVVKLLIEHGADVNRMHVRSGLLPIDYAKSRGYKEIEKKLIEHGAKGHYMLPDWVETDIKGSGILSHVTLRLGKILPTDITTPINVDPVKLKLVPVNSGKNRVLFTFGLFEFHKPMIELFIILPQYWNFYDESNVNQFPILFLSTIIEKIKLGLQIKEGDYFLSNSEDYCDIEWPKGIAGFFVSDVTWKSEKNKEELSKIIEENPVTLFTLIPVKETKSGFTKQSIEKSREAGWAKLTVPLS